MSDATILATFDNLTAQLAEQKKALLTRLEELDKERAEIKAKLGRVRKPRQKKA